MVGLNLFWKLVTEQLMSAPVFFLLEPSQVRKSLSSQKLFNCHYKGKFIQITLWKTEKLNGNLDCWLVETESIFLKKLEMEFSVNEILAQDETILGKGSNASVC